MNAVKVYECKKIKPVMFIINSKLRYEETQKKLLLGLTGTVRLDILAVPYLDCSGLG
jgi:anti-anti-sigma regulatory factor